MVLVLVRDAAAAHGSGHDESERPDALVLAHEHSRVLHEREDTADVRAPAEGREGHAVLLVEGPAGAGPLRKRPQDARREDGVRHGFYARRGGLEQGVGVCADAEHAQLDAVLEAARRNGGRVAAVVARDQHGTVRVCVREVLDELVGDAVLPSEPRLGVHEADTHRLRASKEALKHALGHLENARVALELLVGPAPARDVFLRVDDEAVLLTDAALARHEPRDAVVILRDRQRAHAHTLAALSCKIDRRRSRRDEDAVPHGLDHRALSAGNLHLFLVKVLTTVIIELPKEAGLKEGLLDHVLGAVAGRHGQVALVKEHRDALAAVGRRLLVPELLLPVQRVVPLACAEHVTRARSVAAGASHDEVIGDIRLVQQTKEHLRAAAVEEDLVEIGVVAAVHLTLQGAGHEEEALNAGRGVVRHLGEKDLLDAQVEGLGRVAELLDGLAAAAAAHKDDGHRVIDEVRDPGQQQRRLRLATLALPVQHGALASTRARAGARARVGRAPRTAEQVFGVRVEDALLAVLVDQGLQENAHDLAAFVALPVSVTVVATEEHALLANLGLDLAQRRGGRWQQHGRLWKGRLA